MDTGDLNSCLHFNHLQCQAGVINSRMSVIPTTQITPVFLESYPRLLHSRAHHTYLSVAEGDTTYNIIYSCIFTWPGNHYILVLLNESFHLIIYNRPFTEVQGIGASLFGLGTSNDMVGTSGDVGQAGATRDKRQRGRWSHIL